MRNPWKSLPKRPPFVLASDKPFVDLFNRRAPKAYRVELDLLPEPFNGNSEAPLVVLLLNPGVSPGDFPVNRDPGFRRRALAALAKPGGSVRHSFLAPGMNAPGTDWWLRATRRLIERVGRERVSECVLTIEHFPYHSRKFAHSHLRLPSQDYTFELVRQAMRRKAGIVLARGTAHWFGSVPELAAYRRLVRLRTARSTFISPGNGTIAILRSVR